MPRLEVGLYWNVSTTQTGKLPGLATIERYTRRSGVARSVALFRNLISTQLVRRERQRCEGGREGAY